MSPSVGTPKFVCVGCETCSRYKSVFCIFTSVSHLEWSFFLPFFGGGNIFYMYIIDFMKRKKSICIAFRPIG